MPSFANEEADAKFSCEISLTSRGLRPLHDSRPESARKGELTGGSAVTLGGVGGFGDVSRLLRSCRDWEGPKVRKRRDARQEGNGTVFLMGCAA